MAKVNLDALIPREDFEVDGGASVQWLADKLKISELETGGQMRVFTIKLK